jgi:uncharacterized protein YegL
MMTESMVPEGAAARRRSVILLLDASAWMREPTEAGRIVDLLNDRIRDWLPHVRQEGSGRLSETEFAVITFGGHGVRVLTGPPEDPDRAFIPAARLDIGPIGASGTTPMVAALNLAADLCEARTVARPGLQPIPAHIVLLSHGGPNDRNLPRDAWQDAAARIADLCAAGRARFAVFGLPGSGEQVLRAIAGPGGYSRLDGFDFAAFFDLLLDAGAHADPLEAIRARIRAGWGVDG